MSKLSKTLGIALFALVLFAITPIKLKAQEISSQEFYDALEPYGTWVSDPQYGDVWVPDAEDGFTPYGTDGHWVLTDYGYTWVSDYPWGWATFHYGRWHYDDYYGWEWVPGYEWAPAWVNWREGGGYYSWAPLMPGISFSLSFGGGYRIPSHYWMAVPQRYIDRPNLASYYAPRTRIVNIIHNTTIINNTYVNGGHHYIAGPRVTEVERITNRRPEVYHINNTNTPGRVDIRNNTVNIYRPAIAKVPDARPARVVDGSAYKQQNPDHGIAHRAENGRPVFNHENAAKLAEVAHSTAPNNNVVRINRPERNEPGRSAERGGERFNGGQVQPNANRPGGQPQIPAAQPNTAQPQNNNNREDRNRFDNRAGTPPSQQVDPAQRQRPNGNPDPGFNRRGRPENRPNVNPANPQAAPPQQQQTPPPANNDAQRQAQEQQRAAQEQQRAVQEQQRQQQMQQQNQAQDAQRQAREQQRQQRMQQMQQQRMQQQQQNPPANNNDAQQRAQQDAQRQQQAAQQAQQQRAQQDAMRQQQQQAQQAQQQAQQQRAQEDAQRQQQQQAQQQAQQQRAQQDAQRQQQQQQAQRQQQEQQRQQQRQQQQQQREQRQQQPPPRQETPPPPTKPPGQ